MTALQGDAVKYLLSLPEVVASVGQTAIEHTPFIFRDEMLVNLEDGQYSAVSALVVEDGGAIATPGLTRFRNRRISISIWANGSRDVTGNLIDPKTVEDRIFDTFKVVDKYLHRTDTEPVKWINTITYASERIGDISKPVAITDGDGIKTAVVHYAVLI